MHACDSPQSCLNPMNYSLPVSSIHGDSPGKNTGVGCHVLLPGIFLTQGMDTGIFCPLNWQVGSSKLAPPRKSHFSHKYSHNVISHFTFFFIFNVTFYIKCWNTVPSPWQGLWLLWSAEYDRSDGMRLWRIREGHCSSIWFSKAFDSRGR